MIAGAAALVSLGTWTLFSEYFSYFGVLHAIALFSLMALPLVRAPMAAVLGVAAIFFAAPALYSSTAFDVRWLSWIGFFVHTPETADLVPVFPWFGVVLLGIAGTRLLRETRAWPAIAARHFADPLSRVLRFLGRWSLIVYLVHQPLILGAVYPLWTISQQQEQARAEAFTQSCTASCSAAHDAPFCAAYCSCTLEMTTRDDLWAVLAAPSRTPVQQSGIDQMTKLCTAMAQPSP
jgi:uncharacterized membrane protein